MPSSFAFFQIKNIVGADAIFGIALRFLAQSKTAAVNEVNADYNSDDVGDIFLHFFFVQNLSNRIRMTS